MYPPEIVFEFAKHLRQYAVVDDMCCLPCPADDEPVWQSIEEVFTNWYNQRT